ncbi:MAG: hypothetical protein M1835_001766 [Candelina submexicana]|nr:MAG: hypothetical protein M1835_001766 [Candelina submexicana]
MHYSVPLLVAALAAPLISAQSLSDFPPCAQTCNKIAQRVKPCDFDDLNCICKEADYITTVAQCEQNTCDPTGVTEEQTLARRKCAPVGIATEDVNVINPKDIPNGDDVFPKCAQDCISQASAATGVDVKDYKSLCFNNRGVLDTLLSCQRASCSQAEYNRM